MQNCKVAGSKGQVARGVLLLASCYLLLSYFPIAFAEEFRYDSHARRDPFVPVLKTNGSKQLENTKVHLEGIVLDPTGGSFAVINGQVVRQGEEFQGFTLVKIAHNKVLFKGETTSFELVLNAEVPEPEQTPEKGPEVEVFN